MKYRTPQKIAEINKLYAIDRTPGAVDSEGSLTYRYYSKGRLTLRQISERVGVPIDSVYKIVKGR